MKNAKVISYVRVSTKRQGESGLGLEAQQEAVARHCRSIGARLLKEYVEIESGKKSDRPELAAALADCKRRNATLVVAKLDRLSRNVAFLSALMESGVPFVACDNPSATKLTLHVLAAVAEHEREAISIRTKAALAAAKARGTKLGGSNIACRNLTDAARRRGQKLATEAAAAAASAHYADIAPLVRELSDEGLSQRAIASELNERGFETRRGREWTGVQVGRLLSRGDLAAFPGERSR